MASGLETSIAANPGVVLWLLGGMGTCIVAMGGFMIKFIRNDLCARLAAGERLFDVLVRGSVFQIRTLLEICNETGRGNHLELKKEGNKLIEELISCRSGHMAEKY